MTEKCALHWEEEGVNAFSTNIRNVSLYKAIQRLLALIMDNMSCELTEKDTYRVADFGTADGANFLNIVQNIKDHVSKKFGADQQILVQLNDISTNDFKSVWNNIEGIKSGKGIYFATVAESFYSQCFPSNSVHLAFATAASHFIKSPGDLEVKGTICPTVVQDDKAKSLITSSVEKDWEEFLLLRSEELASGGILVCSSLGTDAEDDWIWQLSLFEPMDSVWEMLYKDGYITQSEMDSGFIPMIIRSASEHKKPFLDPQSSVSRSGLELIHFEKLRSSWLEYYKKFYDEKDIMEKQSGVLKELAQILISCSKAIYYPHVYRCLSPERSEDERKDIMEKFYEKLAQRHSSTKAWLDFPDDTAFHIMIMKKK